MNETVGVEELFGSKVFTRATMRERLPKNVYREVIKVTEEGGELTLQSADVIAKAMKDWAVENGATHYTHWFQPLTGITAEARLLCDSSGCRRKNVDGIFGKGTDQGRAGCILISFRRSSRYF